MPNPSSVSEILDRVEEIEEAAPMLNASSILGRDVVWLCTQLRAALQDVQRIAKIRECISCLPIRRLIAAVRATPNMYDATGSMAVDCGELRIIVDRLEYAIALSSPEGTL